MLEGLMIVGEIYWKVFMLCGAAALILMVPFLITYTVGWIAKMLRAGRDGAGW